MKTILFYDCETSGLDPATSEILEVAGVLWSIEHASTIASFGCLIKAESNAAEAINGIPPALLAYGEEPEMAFNRLRHWFARADVIIAHNAQFDRKFLPPDIDAMKPWICSLHDIPWSPTLGSKSLINLCLAYGIGVSHAHRALTDCVLLARLFERIAERGPSGAVDMMLERAMRPKRRYRAITGRFDAEKNKLYRESGFQWDPEKKEWWKTIPLEDVERLAAEFQFQIEAA